MTNTDISIQNRSIEDLKKRVGNTPLYPLRHFSSERVRIFAKLEWEQLGGSIKARPAAEMLRRDLESRPFRDGQRFLEATSGNTGIALAQLTQAAGFPLTIVLPSNASKRRIELLRHFGAEIHFSSRLDGTDGAQDMAKELKNQYPETFRYLDQYNNMGNYLAHYQNTGPEIWQQTRGKITHFITGIGTSGSFRGITEYLRAQNPEIKAIALQPDSPMHGLEGWKHMETAKIPGIYLPELPDEHHTIATEEALHFIPEIYALEGLWISPSAAANLAGALRLASQLEEGVIVTLFPDDGSKYKEIFNPFRS